MALSQKILMAIIFFFGAFNLVAADQMPEKKVFYQILEPGKSTNNLCCHGCRISSNRATKKAVAYKSCLKCSMSFCTRATCPTGSDPFSERGCVVCEDECCCCYDQCLEDHVHCFTARRTEKRYAECEDLKWKKIRKEYQIKTEVVKSENPEIDHKPIILKCSDALKKNRSLIKNTPVNLESYTPGPYIGHACLAQERIIDQNTRAKNSLVECNKNSLTTRIKREPCDLTNEGPQAKKQKAAFDNKPVLLEPCQNAPSEEADSQAILSAQLCSATDMILEPDDEIFVAMVVRANIDDEEDPEIAYLENEVFRFLSPK